MRGISAMLNAASPLAAAASSMAVRIPSNDGTSSLPNGIVIVASTAPATALPAACPHMRTNWLIPLAAAVSDIGTAAVINIAVDANARPTPKPAIVAQSTTCSTECSSQTPSR